MSLLEVIDESFCLNDPAAAFLELIKAEPPSLLIFAINDLSSGVGFFKDLRRLSISSSFFLFLFSALKLSVGIYISPLISISPLASVFNRNGKFMMVFTLCVTSSPITPSPRVSPC